MDVIKVVNFLPAPAKNESHPLAISMRETVRGMAESNGGTLMNFEVQEPRTALLFVLGEQAMQAVVKEFKVLPDVVVSLVPALTVALEKNQRAQEKSDRMKARWKRNKPA